MTFSAGLYQHLSIRRFISETALIAATILALPLARVGCASAAVAVASPDGKLSIEFELKSNPQPYLPGERIYYRVSYLGSTLLTDSPLGIDFKGAPPLDHDFGVVSSDHESHDSTWETVVGAQRKIPDHYNQLTVALRERRPPGRRLNIILRAYNEGVAFRYYLPKQDALDQFIISSEETAFCFARPVSAYALSLGHFDSPYEAPFRKVTLDQIKPTSIVGLPLLVQFPGGPSMALLEADLTDYAGMYVAGIPGFPNALMSKLSPPPDRSDEAVKGATPKATPWRVLMVNPRPAGLIESNYLTMNLNPPCALTDTSWIKPGKTSLFWWVGHYPYPVSFQAGENMETLRHYIDFSSQRHLEYVLFDDGWSTHEDIIHAVGGISIPDLVAYGREKGVRVLLWMPWTAVDKQLDEAFPLYEKWGVAGVKVDFMNRDDQEMVNFYDRVIKKAAQNHLIVDFHGAFKPTGLRRTYPNLISREAVMGLEYSLWSDRTTPEHDVTIPFTRMLAGPLDYAPGAFRNATRADFKPRGDEAVSQGTRAHQLALYVVFENPLGMVWGYPESYENQPGIEFLEVVPTTWDETRVLDGEVAEHIAIGRGKGNVWYLGALTNWDERDMELPLDFLSAGEYEAKIFADGPDANTVATSLKVSTTSVTATGKLRIHLASGGGAAVILTPAGH
jgi:alpha-glucosidase